MDAGRATPAVGVIGMAAMMGGTMRSPLTAMFFLLELTRDFNAFARVARRLRGPRWA